MAKETVYLDPKNERDFFKGIESFKECVDLLKNTTNSVDILNNKIVFEENIELIKAKATVSYFLLDPVLDKPEWEMSLEIMNKTENITNKGDKSILENLLKKAERL